MQTSIEIAIQRINDCVKLNSGNLNLDGLKITDIPIEVLEIKNLMYLTLRGNNFSRIPNLVFELTKLERLDISHNNITSIPPEISKLTNLHILKANDNNIHKVAPEISRCKNLTTLYLSQNNLIEIPESILDLKRLKVIGLWNNPNLKSPPLEIATSNVGAVFNYLSSLKVNKRCVDNYEAKLIIVGEGNTGKTCLKQRIVKNLFDDKTNTTHGIEIGKWETEINGIVNFRVNVWDFGGQEIYHATHQYFLTRRSLYLFVWTARTDDDIHIFDKWLNTINSLSNSSPIIIIQNKIDERYKNINTDLLLSQFPNIIGFFSISVKTGEGFADLIKKVKKSLISLEHVGSKLPSVWVEIRKNLEASTSNYLTLDEFSEICKTHGLTEENIEYLSEYFHDIGVFLHFKDNIILKQIVFVNPAWATNSVYSLIDNKNVISSYGEFDNSTLETAWKNYAKNCYPILLELMLKFELSYKYDWESKYIIPNLLPESPLGEIKWDYSNNHQLIYRYKHLSSNIISRFIVKVHDLISGKKVWKFGVILKHNNSEAYIRYNPFEKEIIVNTNGQGKRSLLEFIRREFEKIHKSINLAPSENIPCNCLKCSSSSDKFLWDYDFLIKAHDKGVNEILCQKSLEKVSTNEVLLGMTGEAINYEKEIYETLLKLRKEIQDDRRFIQKANKIISLKPNIFGLGIDFNELIKRFVKIN